MRKLIPVLLLLPFTLWIACGGDDDGGTNGPNGTGPIRIVASTTATEPTLSSPDEATWATVDSTSVPVKLGAPKSPAKTALDHPDEIQVQAIMKTNYLYLRLIWRDTSFNVWPKYYEVSDINETSTPPSVSFTIGDAHPNVREDQVYVMFDNIDDGWDLWNWRVLTTGSAMLGLGYTWDGIQQEPTLDAPGTTSVSVVATSNPPIVSEPTFCRFDSSGFNGYMLYIEDTASLSRLIRMEYDPIAQDSYPVYYRNTLGWQIGQRVPGMLIDTTLKTSDRIGRGSRWDIDAVSDYLGATEYHLVLRREMTTGFGDDLDLAALDSVKVKIGIYNRQQVFGGSNNLGMSEEFWLILP